MTVDEACHPGSDPDVCSAAYEHWKVYHKNHANYRDLLWVPVLMVLLLSVLLFIFQAGASWLARGVLLPRHKVGDGPLVFAVFSVMLMGMVLLLYYSWGLLAMGMIEDIQGEGWVWYLDLFYLVAKPFEALLVLETAGVVLFSAILGVVYAACSACGYGPRGPLLPLDRDVEASLEDGSTEPKDEDLPAAAHDECLQGHELSDYDSTHASCGTEEQHCAEADFAVDCGMDDCGCD